MQESDQITLNQSAFYYTRLHDFNNDGGLDGLELLLAVKHSLVHVNSSLESNDLESFAGIVFINEKYIQIILIISNRERILLVTLVVKLFRYSH